MRCWYVSQMDARAQMLARSCGMGVELIDFCIPENMENAALIRDSKDALKGFALSLHAPYYEIFPCAIDPLIREVAMHRLRRCAALCAEMGARRMIAHSGYMPQLYYPQWFVPKSICFWKEFIAQLPDQLELLLENVLDVSPEHIARVCDGVGDERLRICLDVGHANAYSPVPVTEWIRTLGSRIAHVHLHNNDGSCDAHNALGDGSMNMLEVLEALDVHAPSAALCIESMDAQASLRYLMEHGIIETRKL